jgi:predicted RNase H-like HicB family nuclease
MSTRDRRNVDFGDITEEQRAEARRYSLVLHWSDEDRVFLAEVPELPGLITHGESQADAVEMAVEVIALFLQSARHDGRPIPEPRLALAS